MENRWSDLDAEAAIERYTKQGVNLDVALRTYSTGCWEPSRSWSSTAAATPR